MNASLTWVIAFLGAIVCLVSLKQLRDLGTAWMPNIALACLPILAGLYQSEVLNRTTVLQAAIVGLIALVAVRPNRGVEIASRSETVSARISVGLVLCLWLTLFAANSFQNLGLSEKGVYTRILALAYLIPLLLVASRQRIDGRSFALGAAMGLGAIVAISPLQTETWRVCDEFKCGVADAIFVGAFSSENYLGVFAALTIIAVAGFVPHGLRSARNWPLLLLVLTLFLVTASRTSGVAAIAGLLTLALLRRVATVRVGAGAKLLVIGSALTIIVTGLVILQVTDPTSFSNRGRIWQAAISDLDGRRLLGLGIDRWSGYEGVAAVSYHFPHSEYLLIFYSGGFVAIGVLSAFILSAIPKSNETPGLFAARSAYVITFLAIGLLEIVYNPMTVDGLAWSVIPFLAFTQLKAPESPEAARGAEQLNYGSPSKARVLPTGKGIAGPPTYPDCA